MKHKILAATLPLAIIMVLATIPACTPEDPPLPEVEGVAARLSPQSPANGQDEDTIIISWNQSRDSRVEGYAIYRAEQGIGATTTDKSDYTLQAITIATQYVDDEIRTTERYPTMRYFYRISVIISQGAQGPLSPEVSIDYVAAS